MTTLAKTPALVTVRNATFKPKGFPDEAALLESIVQSCKGARTAMLTANYVVKEGPNTEPDDPRLLGEKMLLTIELCARVHARCVSLGVDPPALVMVPNDLVPGTFSDLEEARGFKKDYRLPEEIAALLTEAGIRENPVYFFTRDFAKPRKKEESEWKELRRLIRNNGAGLIVVFESFAQNLATKRLNRGHVKHSEEIEKDDSGKRALIVPAPIVDTFSSRPQISTTAVTITNPNGSPFCSFLAATLMRELENLGFGQMVNTFVKEEYPCVDKAAAVYKYLYEGKMRVRNIYLDGENVVVDNSIG